MQIVAEILALSEHPRKNGLPSPLQSIKLLSLTKTFEKVGEQKIGLSDF